MWSNKLIAAVLLAACGLPAQAQVIKCPVSQQGHSLTTLGLFDGPPDQLYELVPQDGGWKLGYKAASPYGFFISCEYNKSPDDQNPIELNFHVKPNVSACLFQNDTGVVCK